MSKYCSVLVLSLILCLIGGTSVTAENEDKSYNFAKGSDITGIWADKPIHIVAGLQAKDRLSYKVSVLGEADAWDGVAGYSSSSYLNATLDIQLEEVETSKELDAEFRYTMISLDANHNGERWGLAVSDNGNDDDDKLWLNGKEPGREAKGLPTAASLRSNLTRPVAFSRLGGRNQLVRPAHPVNFGRSDSDTLNDPARLIDPTAFMRLLFLGLGNVDAVIGKPFVLGAKLTIGTTAAKSIDYEITLTPSQIFGEDEEARGLLCGISAKSHTAQVLLNDSVNIAPPVFAGTALIDVQKGVVVSLSLSGTYADTGRSASKLSGKVTYTTDVDSGKNAGR